MAINLKPRKVSSEELKRKLGAYLTETQGMASYDIEAVAFDIVVIWMASGKSKEHLLSIMSETFDNVVVIPDLPDMRSDDGRS